MNLRISFLSNFLVPRKGTALFVLEKIPANLGRLRDRSGDRMNGSGQILPIGPQNTGFRQTERNREKYLDWLAEGVGFEPTRPFRA
jgi:hypothetical protein